MKREFRVIGTVILTKVRVCRYQRRCHACSVVKSFLLALEKHKLELGLSVGMIIQCQRWRRCRDCAIVVQHFWRSLLQVKNCQVEFIDMQWRRKQDERTERECEERYLLQKRHAEEVNSKLESVNRMRTLMKMRPLPQKKVEPRGQIRRKLLEGGDLLDCGHIVPREIRSMLIKEFLKWLRKQFYEDMVVYHAKIDHIKKQIKDRTDTFTKLTYFAGHNVAAKWQSEQAVNCMDVAANVTGVANEITILELQLSRKPKFSLMLEDEELKKLMMAGEACIESIRVEWSPDQSLGSGGLLFQHIVKEISMLHHGKINNKLPK